MLIFISRKENGSGIPSRLVLILLFLYMIPLKVFSENINHLQVNNTSSYIVDNKKVMNELEPDSSHAFSDNKTLDNMFLPRFFLKGEFFTSFSYYDKNSEDSNGYFRYIPEFTLSQLLNETISFDLNAAINANWTTFFDGAHDSRYESEIEWYRLYAKISTNQFETRLGLQKINFGSARILRSVMWFDQIDPFDPLQTTSGVWALLTRYYFLNNANIWLWGLYGNDEIKGLEYYESKRNEIEYGGRFQLPIAKGEIALSYHQRRLNPADWESKMFIRLNEGKERRLALDAFWDIKVGTWFEIVLSEIRYEISQNELNMPNKSKYTRLLNTFGTDYTFRSGIHILGEYFIQTSGSGFDDMSKDTDIIALYGNYSFNIIDKLTVAALYECTNNDIYGLVQWQRIYDKWQFSLQFSISDNAQDQGLSNIMSGGSIMLFISFYH